MLLFYSNHCKFSYDAIVKLDALNLLPKMQKICVDTKDPITHQRNPLLAKYNIKNVPSIVDPDSKQVLTGAKVFHWIQLHSSPSSGPPPPDPSSTSVTNPVETPTNTIQPFSNDSFAPTALGQNPTLDQSQNNTSTSSKPKSDELNIQLQSLMDERNQLPPIARS